MVEEIRLVRAVPQSGVAVDRGDGEPSITHILVSDDAINWHPRDVAFNEQMPASWVVATEPDPYWLLGGMTTGLGPNYPTDNDDATSGVAKSADGDEFTLVTGLPAVTVVGFSTTGYSASAQADDGSRVISSNVEAPGGGSTTVFWRSDEAGIVWTAATTEPLYGGINDIEFGDGRFVAAGQNQSYTGVESIKYVMSYSTDGGVTWAPVGTPLESISTGVGYISGLHFNGTRWVAVGGYQDDTDFEFRIASLISEDGASWFVHDIVVENGYLSAQLCVTYSPLLDRWVMGLATPSYDVAPLIWTSDDDGVTWTSRSTPFGLSGDVGLQAVTWNADLALFVAVGSSQMQTQAVIGTSPDGITWTQRTIANLGSDIYPGVLFDVAADQSGRLVAVGRAVITGRAPLESSTAGRQSVRGHRPARQVSTTSTKGTATERLG